MELSRRASGMGLPVRRGLTVRYTAEGATLTGEAVLVYEVEFEY